MAIRSDHYSVSRVLKLRDTIVANLTLEVGTTPKGDDFRRVVRIVWESLTDDGLGSDAYDMEALKDTLADAAGVPLTPESVATMAHRVAGNTARLKQRRSAGPWSRQRFYEWVPVQVTGVRLERGGRGEAGASAVFKVMAGTPCTRSIVKWWPSSRFRFLSRKLGFTRPPSDKIGSLSARPYADPRQFVQLRMSALIDPTMCESGPDFSVVETPPKFQDWNRAVVRRRYREGFSCPLSLPMTSPCHRCPMGYVGKGRCPAACRRLPCVEIKCRGCGKRRLADPEDPGLLCLSCRDEAYRNPRS